MTIAHHIKRMLQVDGIMRPDGGPHMSTRMTEFELHGVQPLPFQSELSLIHI